MNKRDFIHDNFPMQSKASPYLQLGTNYFVINPAWQSGKLPMPITEETTVNSKLQSKLQIEKAVEIISEEISPKEKDIEIMPDEKVYAGIDFGNKADSGTMFVNVEGKKYTVASIESINITKEETKIRKTPIYIFDNIEKPKQNFREVLPKKSRKRKEWK